jgi:hypothetical protein
MAGEPHRRERRRADPGELDMRIPFKAPGMAKA